jgi:hypothetical protein
MQQITKTKFPTKKRESTVEIIIMRIQVAIQVQLLAILPCAGVVSIRVHSQRHECVHRIDDSLHARVRVVVAEHVRDVLDEHIGANILVA